MLLFFLGESLIRTTLSRDGKCDDDLEESKSWSRRVPEGEEVKKTRGVSLRKRGLLQAVAASCLQPCTRLVSFVLLGTRLVLSQQTVTPTSLRSP